MDKHTKEQRSKNMQAIKGKDSKIELFLRKALWKKGYRYRKWQIRKKEINSNKAFWIKKIEANIQRDKQVNQSLENLGWTVLRFWGQDIKKDVTTCIAKIEESMRYMQ